MVQDFGHNRYAYSLSEQLTAHSIFINSIDLIPPVMVVLDPTWVKRMYGLSMQFDQIPNGLETNATIKFFTVKWLPIYARL